jgi:hypothetical protein
MRAAGVPEPQLMAVAGGERIPLFARIQREKAKAADGSPGVTTSNSDEAVITVHAWPSLHAVMPPGDHRSFPEVIDFSTVYTGSGSYQRTLDVTQGVTYGLGSLLKVDPIPPQMHLETKEFIAYMKDRELNRYSFFDGGQMMYNFLIDSRALLWDGHLGAYEGIMRSLEPKPNTALLAIAGRANLNGRPFDGSAVDFAVKELNWIGKLAPVIWCLYDEGVMNQKFSDIDVAATRVEAETQSRVFELAAGKIYTL